MRGGEAPRALAAAFGRRLQAALSGACKVMQVEAGTVQRLLQGGGGGEDLAVLVAREEAKQLPDPEVIDLRRPLGADLAR
jgi:hypothetical protein